MPFDNAECVGKLSESKCNMLSLKKNPDRILPTKFLPVTFDHALGLYPRLHLGFIPDFIKRERIYKTFSCNISHSDEIAYISSIICDM